MVKNAIFSMPADEVAAFCVAHRVRRLSLFGSMLTGTGRPDSDVDLLVEFESGAPITLLDMARMQAGLSERLGGRVVDLRTPRDLSPLFRDAVMRKARPLYVA